MIGSFSETLILPNNSHFQIKNHKNSQSSSWTSYEHDEHMNTKISSKLKKKQNRTKQQQHISGRSKCKHNIENSSDPDSQTTLLTNSNTKKTNKKGRCANPNRIQQNLKFSFCFFHLRFKSKVLVSLYFFFLSKKSETKCVDLGDLRRVFKILS